MTKAVIFQYGDYSNGARNLSNELKKGGRNSLHTLRSSGGGMRLAATIYGDTPLTEPHVCICWGKPALSNANASNRLFLNWINKENIINKKRFFIDYADRFRNSTGVRFPVVFYNRADAIAGMANLTRGEGNVVLVERHSLAGHSGDGIRLVKEGDEVSPNAGLYVQYIPKAEEYRVHFFKTTGQFWVQQKRLKATAIESDTRYTIRNHHNGWVYCTEDLNVPEDVLEQARRFVAHPYNKLDFGAIDIIYNRRQNQAYVLEVNSAPGVEGRTVSWYAQQIKDTVARHNFSDINNYFNPIV
jgi:hypothetical protein